MSASAVVCLPCRDIFDPEPFIAHYIERHTDAPRVAAAIARVAARRQEVA